MTTDRGTGPTHPTEGLTERKECCLLGSPPPVSLRNLDCGTGTDPDAPSSGCGWRAGPAAWPSHQRPLSGHGLCCSRRAMPTAHPQASRCTSTHTDTNSKTFRNKDITKSFSQSGLNTQAADYRAI